MSFDIFLQCFAGEPPGISRGAVRALFPIVEEASEPDHWRVRYDSTNSCTVSITPAKSNNELITSLCINRPCGDLQFWESVLTILRMGSVMLYWPGGGPLVAGQSLADEAPLEIVEALGKPVSVNSAQEIIDAIRES
jgi:hypothetical protein